MQESEMKIIPQKQSFWWKIGGWLPVVIMSGIFFSLAYVLQSIPPTPTPVSTGTENVSAGVAWTDWVPLVLTIFFVVVGITVAILKREKIKTFVEWNEKEPESKKWFWYIIVLIITITLSSVSPDEHRYTVAMITALLGLHVVWLVLLKDQTVSTTTKVVVTGFFFFYITAGLLPGTSDYFGSKWRVIKKDVAVKGAEEKEYAEKYEKGIISAKVQPVEQSIPETTSSSGLSTIAIVVPVGTTIEVARPVGHYLASVNCPKEVVMEVTDMDTGAAVKQQDCAETVRGGNLPLNISLAFFQKGDEGGPVDVLVRWKKIS